jgi:rubrerythrin
MASVSVRDVIDKAKALHQQLGQFYAQLSADEPRERIKMLLDYMSRHEKHLESALARFEQDAKAPILKSWFKGDAGAPELLGQTPRVTASMGTADVIKMALSYDDALIDLYERLASSGAPPAVREFFGQLVLHERKEERRMVRDTIEMDEV